MSALEPLVIELPAGTTLFRVVRASRGVDGALHFGPAPGSPPLSRFDSPTGAFRVCYLAESREGAFAEAVLRLATPLDETSGTRLVAMRALDERSWAQTTTRRVMRLADLCGPGLAQIGQTGALTMSDDHLAARQLSARVHALSPKFDGIRFRLRHDPDETGIALYDRATKAIGREITLTPMLSEPRRLGALLDRYGVGLDA